MAIKESSKNAAYGKENGKVILKGLINKITIMRQNYMKSKGHRIHVFGIIVWRLTIL